MEPAQAVAHLLGKGYVITGVWHEMLGRAHAKAIAVAHVAKLDILHDIHRALVGALRNGTPEVQIIKNLTPFLQAKGWWGKAIDPTSGEISETYAGTGRPVQYGSPARLKTIIIRTNLQSAYMAGRYQGDNFHDAKAAFVQSNHLLAAFMQLFQGLFTGVFFIHPEWTASAAVS
jgi:uncharacterized protein with gpF-like domain